MANTGFKADKDTIDALVHLRKKTGVGRLGETNAGEPVLATSLWGMFYADDTGVVLYLSEQLRKAAVCAAFGFTLSEAKTEFMCLRTKGMPEFTIIFNVEATGQVYNQTNELVYLGGNVNNHADLTITIDCCIRNAWCCFRN